MTSRFYGHLGLLLLDNCMFTGIYPSIHIIQLLIYVPFFFLTASVTLLTSTLGVLVRDTQMLMQAILRILFYFSPIYTKEPWYQWFNS